MSNFMAMKEAGEAKADGLLPPVECQSALANEGTLLLDLRDAGDAIKGANTSFTLGNLALKADPEMGALSDPVLAGHRDQPIIVTCDAGGVAAIGAGILKDFGFKDVKIMAGGMAAWLEAGLPVETTPYDWGSFSLAGKTAIVTGGASGIGLGISELFAKKGANTFIVDLKAEDAERAAAEVSASTGGKCTGVGCNVADQAAVDAAWAQVTAATGGQLDIVVNNAGIAAVGTVLECTPEDMDKCYNVNIKGVYHCTQATVKVMKEKGGVILNLASIASRFGIKDRFAYSMSKGAVLTMTYATATDHNAVGIRCNAIAPARIYTPFVQGFLDKSFPDDPTGKQAKFEELSAYQPMARMGQPKEVAALALYLASDEASFCTGHCYSVDGGVENCWDAARPQAAM